MNCLFDKEIIRRSINGKIEPLEKVFLEEHMKQCEECSVYFEKLKREKKENHRGGLKNSIPRVEKKVGSLERPKNKIEKPMGIIEILLRGATAGHRAIPIKAIGKNILMNMRKNKNKIRIKNSRSGGRGWEFCSS